MPALPCQQANVARLPDVKVADSVERILEDPEIKLVAAAAVPCERGPLGLRVMDAGKDYFTDKVISPTGSFHQKLLNK